MGAPDRIYLQWHGDADPADYPNGPDPSLDDVTWCADKIYEHDIEYVPANEVTRLRDELAELHPLLCRAFQWMNNVPTDEQLDAQVPALGGLTGRELVWNLRIELFVAALAAKGE